jgi:hypothetical protein
MGGMGVRGEGRGSEGAVNTCVGKGVRYHSRRRS